MSTTKTNCFRIARIPSEWTKDNLIDALRTIDPVLRDQNPQLSLYPACCDAAQTALINLATCSEYFQNLKLDEFNYARVSTDGVAEILLTIDSLFYGLTPLNTPKGEIHADVIAMTGLAGHAFGSWRSRETGSMWLKDFLPQDVKGIRIMSYGYNSNLVGSTIDDQFLDYRRRFIEVLTNARRLPKTLLQSKNKGQYKQIFDSTHMILFFGTLHQGLEIDELQSMVEEDVADGRSSKSTFLEQLREGSVFLDTQRENTTGLWNRGSDIGICSFYETRKTGVVRKSPSGKWVRNGKAIEMVKKNSA